MPAARELTLRASPLALLREPLFWAAAAVFVGTSVGLVGTFAQAVVVVSYTPSLSTVLFAEVTQPSGEVLVAVSLLGVGALLGVHLWKVGRLASGAGVVLLLLLVAAEAIRVLYSPYWNMGEKSVTLGRFPALETTTFFTSLFLPTAVVLTFAVAALWGRDARLGATLLGLCVLGVPFGRVWLLLFPPDSYAYYDPSAYYEPSASPVLFGWYGGGVSLLEAPLWALLGAMFLRGARGRVLGKASRAQEKENLQSAHHLYEEGLGRGDLSVVEELVSEEFRDLRHGSRGRLGMERVLTSLLDSFPDLSVSVEVQEAEGDLVRTRLSLTGTDRGGVLWYPPTDRHAAFTAEFVDRFSGGELVEHDGGTDTGELLRQLGLPPGGAQPYATPSRGPR